MRSSSLFLPLCLAMVTLTGCGTTRWSDTSRTATEQLLLSSAVDQAINNIDFSPLAGKDVYFDAQYLAGSTDEKYVVSSLRQHLLAYGCILKKTREDAIYIVEARAGAVGTNRHDLLLGVPAFNLPSVGPLTGMPSAIPEIPFAKATDQKGIAKIAVFAYNQETGQAVWQSGAFPVVATAKDTWVAGIGPLQRGSIYDGTRFAGSRMILSGSKDNQHLVKPAIPVAAEAIFQERPLLAQKSADKLSIDATPSKEVTHAHLPDAGTSEEKTEAVVPAGRIVRLPALDEQARPDLKTPPEASADSEVERQPAARPAAKEPNPAATSADFSIFRPGTWFN